MESYLSLRASLKIQLYSERGKFFPGIGLKPVCPLCKKPILGDPEMHEALLTRGDAPGENQGVIMSAANCVLVHPECHAKIQGSGGPEIYRMLVSHLIENVGNRRIREFLEEVIRFYPVVGKQARIRFNNYLMGFE